MTFVRRSRKGRIHVVRERIANNYVGLSRGLARANKNVIDGVWSVHKGLQLGLAKGHQSIQSGLKTAQDITGDFNMYQQSNSYYQYQPPVAMFSMAEVDKYNQYSDNGMAYFERKALPGKGGSSAGSVKARWQRGTASAGRAFKSAGEQVGRTTKQASYRVSEGVKGAGSAANKFVDAAGRGAGGAAHGAYRTIANNPRLAGLAALGVGATALGVGGATFLRRRRTKSGKIVMEQVRR